MWLQMLSKIDVNVKVASVPPESDFRPHFYYLCLNLEDGDISDIKFE